MVARAKWRRQLARNWPAANSSKPGAIRTHSANRCHLFVVGSLLILLLLLLLPAQEASSSLLRRHESLALSSVLLEHEAPTSFAVGARAAVAGENDDDVDVAAAAATADDDDDELKQLSSQSQQQQQQRQRQSANYRPLNFGQLAALTTNVTGSYTKKLAEATAARRRKRHSAGARTTANKEQAAAAPRRQVIQAMLKGQVVLPCNLEPPPQVQSGGGGGGDSDDAAVLVLWYKDKSSVPIYSVDARSTPVQEARHKPGPYLEGRSMLRIQSSGRQPAASHKRRRRRRQVSELFDEQEDNREFPVVMAAPGQPEVQQDEQDDSSELLEVTVAAPEQYSSSSNNNNNYGGNSHLVPRVNGDKRISGTRLRRHKRRQPQLVAQLVVDSLSSEDNGLYSCRVDFRKARARTQEFDLRIIVPADKPVIRDLTGGGGAQVSQVEQAARGANLHSQQQQQQTMLLGPHSEGARIVLECETQGGYPEPALSWWRDGHLIDDAYEIVSGADGHQLEPAADRFRSGSGGGGLIGSAATDGDMDELSASSARLAAAAAVAPDDERALQVAQEMQAAATSAAAAAAAAATNGKQGRRLIRNRLELGPLTRADLMANYSCQAWNTKLSEPPTTSAMIDMNLRPIKVQIENERHPVLADKPLELVCNAYGSRPAAVISWWRGQQRLTSSSSSSGTVSSATLLAAHQSHRNTNHTSGSGSGSNVTSSTLTLVPHLEDAGQLIRCRAESAANNGVTSSSDFIEDSWRLDVHYLPRVKLALGDKLQGTSIREGQDVYFECTVRAQPAAHEIRWWLEGKELETNVSAGVIISNQSLVLQRVKRQQRGRYTCSASNQVGESHSNVHLLRVQFAPICRDTNNMDNSLLIETQQQQQTKRSMPTTSSAGGAIKSHYGAARMESVRVQCHVDAEPAESITYKWAFVAAPLAANPDANSVADTTTTTTTTTAQQTVTKPEFSGQQLVYLDASSVSASAENPLVSVATYTPRTELDYGTLLCWATSPLGQQQEPCAYQVVPAERPDPLRNCRLANATDIQLTVACEPGYDGGVDQSFRMEVYEASDRRQLVANVSVNEPLLLASWWLLDHRWPSGNGGSNNNNGNNGNNGQANNGTQSGGYGDDDGALDAADAGASSSDSDDLSASPAQSSSSPVSSTRQQRQRTVGAQLQLHSAPAHLTSAHPLTNPQQLQSSSASASASASDQNTNTNANNNNNHALGQQPLEAVFTTQPVLEPATDYFLSIYSTNAKGSSKPVAFTVSTQQGAGNGGRQVAAAANSFARDARRANGAEPSHLFGDVLQLSWSPFLLICAVTVLVFVMFASITFAMMKYVDFSPSSGAGLFNASGGSAGTGAGTGLASSSGSCATYNDDDRRPMSRLAFGRDSSPPRGNSKARARVVALTGSRTGDGSNNSTSSSLSHSSVARGKQQQLHYDNQQSSLALLIAQQSQQQQSSTLKPSNSDLQLNATYAPRASAGRSSLCGTLPRNNNSNINHLLAHNNHRSAYSANNQTSGDAQQLTALMLSKPSCSGGGSGGGDGRVEQLVISGKQYIHQTSLYGSVQRSNNNAMSSAAKQQQQRRHLHLTGSTCLAASNLSSPYGSLRAPNAANLYAAYVSQPTTTATTTSSAAAAALGNQQDHDRLVCIGLAGAYLPPPPQQQQHQHQHQPTGGHVIDESYASGADLTAASIEVAGQQAAASAGFYNQLDAAIAAATNTNALGGYPSIVTSDIGGDGLAATIIDGCSPVGCYEQHNAGSSISQPPICASLANHHDQQQQIAMGTGDSDGMSNGIQRSLSTTLTNTTTGSPSSAGLTDLEQNQQLQQQQQKLYNPNSQVTYSTVVANAKSAKSSDSVGRESTNSNSTTSASTLTSATTELQQQQHQHQQQQQQQQRQPAALSSVEGVVRIINNSTLKRPNGTAKFVTSSSVGQQNKKSQQLAQLQDLRDLDPKPTNANDLYEVHPLEQYTMYLDGGNYLGQQQEGCEFFVLPTDDNFDGELSSLASRSHKTRVKLMGQSAILNDENDTQIPIQYRNSATANSSTLCFRSEERDTCGSELNTGTGVVADLHTDV